MSLVESQDRQIGKPATTEAAVARESASVQAAMFVAKQFPRDEDAARDRIMRACKRRSLAEVAQYEYAKGGTKITGPSIRLAEVLAQNWGNMDFGFVELERRPARGGNPGESVVEARAWDLETNTRRSMTFTVLHVRDTKQGRKSITEERDIYELVANQASRRIRACILAVIPADVQEDAVEECERTLTNNAPPIQQQVESLMNSFAKIGVTVPMLESRLQHAMSAVTANELVMLRKIGASIRDGFATVAEQFPAAQQAEGRTLKPALQQPDPDGEMGARE